MALSIIHQSLPTAFSAGASTTSWGTASTTTPAFRLHGGDGGSGLEKTTKAARKKRKLAAAGMTSIEDLQLAEAYQIDMALSRNPPFGSKLLARVAEFPKLRVSVKMTGRVLISSF